MRESLRRYWPLPLLLAAATFVMCYGARRGASQSFYIDERFYDRYALELAQALAERRAVHFGAVHPSGYSVALAVVYGAFYLWGRVCGLFHGSVDFLVRFAVQRSDFVVLGRLLSASFAVGAIAAQYHLALRLFDRRVATIAGLALLFCYPMVFYAHLASNITLLAFLTSLAGCGIAAIWRRGRGADYVCTGACIGVAIGTKYYPALLLLSVVAAHRMRLSPAPLLAEWRKLALLALGVALFAILAFPVPLIAWPQWRHWIGDTLGYYHGGNPLLNAWRLVAGNPGPWAEVTAEPIAWWSNSLRTVGAVGLIWIGCALAWGARRFARVTLLLAAPVVVLFAYQSLRGGLLLGARQLYFGLPLLWIVAAAALVDAIDLARPRAPRPMLALAAALLLAQPVAWTTRYLRLASRPTTLELARDWVDRNLPRDAVLVIDMWEAPFANQVGWREGKSATASLGRGTWGAVAAARAAAAPPYWIREFAYGDADAELDRALGEGRPTFAITALGAYWSPASLAQWGLADDESAEARRRFQRRVVERSVTRRRFIPREEEALGPDITIAEVLPRR